MNATPISIDDDSAEEWRALVHAEGRYEISSHGRIRSLDRIVTLPNGKDRPHRGRVLKQKVNTQNGYWYVQISYGAAVQIGKGRTRSSGATTRSVHQLVAEAFIGDRPPGWHVCHNDGDRSNNRAENLRYGTVSENNLDTVKHGTHWLASRQACDRGHLYLPLNTVYRSPTVRTCRACERALRMAKHYRKTGERFDLEAFADAKYRELLEEFAVSVQSDRDARAAIA